MKRLGAFRRLFLFESSRLGPLLIVGMLFFLLSRRQISDRISYADGNRDVDGPDWG